MAVKLVSKSIRLIGCIVSSAVLMQPALAQSDNLSLAASAGQQNMHQILISPKIERGVTSGKKLTKSVIQVDMNCPRQLVWEKLTDFDRYAEIFRKRLKSCRITRREGSLVFTESFLKPSFFVKEPCQHAINDLSAKPNELKWRVLDGNFRSVEGAWQLSSTDNYHCHVTYTMQVDVGSVVPRPLVSFILKMIQREVISSLKSVSEAAFVAARMKTLENPTTTCEPVKLQSPG